MTSSGQYLAVAAMIAFKDARSLFEPFIMTMFVLIAFFSLQVGVQQAQRALLRNWSAIVERVWQILLLAT